MLSTAPAEILIDGGSWEVSNRLILQSDVEFVANTLGGSIDLPDATLTADQPSTTLSFDIGDADTAFLRLGNVDHSASQQIENLSVQSANAVELQSATFEIPSELSIQNVSTALNINFQISASNLSLQASTIQFLDTSVTANTGDIHIDGPVTVQGLSSELRSVGSVQFESDIKGEFGTESLRGIAGDSIDLNGPVCRIDSLSLQALNDLRLMDVIVVNYDFFASANRIVVSQHVTTDTLSDGSVTFIGRSLITTGPVIEIGIGTGQLTTQGPIAILGDLNINGQGGNILLASTIDGTGVLNLSNPGGNTIIQGSVGQGSIGNHQPLAGVNLLSRQLSVNTIIAQDNTIYLTADEIEFTGKTISTLDSGNILIHGDLTVTMPTGEITSAESVQITGFIRGRLGTETLTVTADDRIDLIGGNQQIASLSLLANHTFQTVGTFSVNQDFTAKSAAVLISGDITLLSGFAGLNTLDAKDLVQIDSLANLAIENGTLSIETEGMVDLANSIITSVSSDAIVLVRGATIITLGNINLASGLVDLQTIPLPTATIGQAIDTSITVSRLELSAGGDILLLNSGKDIEFLKEIITQGDLQIRDDAGVLTIASMVVFGTTVDVSTAATLYLLENAITAEIADVHLQAGMSIINSAVDPDPFNIAGKTLMVSAVTGIGSSAPLQFLSIMSLDVTTVDGGNPFETTYLDRYHHHAIRRRNRYS